MTNERINMRFKLAGTLSLHIVPVRMFFACFHESFLSVCVYVFPSLLLGVHHDTSADKRKVTIWNLYSKTQIPNTFILLEIQSLPDGLVYSLSGLVSTGSVSEILILLCGPYSGIVYDPFLFVLHKRGYVRWGLPRWVWFRPPFPFPVCTMLQSFSSWAL